MEPTNEATPPADPPATEPRAPLVTGRPIRGRIWLVRVVVFSVVFVFLMSVFTVLGSIVESFFVTLYTD